MKLSGTSFALGSPAAVLTASIAEAQTPGMERREERREDRQDLRQDRRDDRQERRDERFGGDRESTSGQSQTAPATTGQAPK